MFIYRINNFMKGIQNEEHTDHMD